jgi:hypothetical protein
MLLPVFPAFIPFQLPQFMLRMSRYLVSAEEPETRRQAWELSVSAMTLMQRINRQTFGPAAGL